MKYLKRKKKNAEKWCCCRERWRTGRLWLFSYSSLGQLSVFFHFHIIRAREGEATTVQTYD